MGASLDCVAGTGLFCVVVLSFTFGTLQTGTAINIMRNKRMEARRGKGGREARIERKSERLGTEKSSKNKQHLTGVLQLKPPLCLP